MAQHLLQLPNGPKELVVIGYSYGACVAANLMEHVPEVGNLTRVPAEQAPASTTWQQHRRHSRQCTVDRVHSSRLCSPGMLNCSGC